jgi:DNA-binding transcriptional regulator YiaG
MKKRDVFREWLLKNNLTQVRAAIFFEVDQRTIRRWVGGDVYPSGAVMLLLEAFKKSPSVEEYLINKHCK